MNKVFLPVFVLFIFNACGITQNSDDEKKLTEHEQAVLLKDSAVSIMQNDPETSGFNESMALLDQAIQKDPRLKSAYFYKMRLYFENGDDEGYFNTMVASNENNPGDPYSSLHLGIQYEKRADFDNADKKYKDAVRLFEARLDTLSATNALIRNTLIMNLALSKTLANEDVKLTEIDPKLSESEIENLNIALNTLKSMNRDDLLNLQSGKHSKNKEDAVSAEN